MYSDQLDGCLVIAKMLQVQFYSLLFMKMWLLLRNCLKVAIKVTTNPKILSFGTKLSDSFE